MPPAPAAGGAVRLRPSIEVFPASTGEVHLMRPGLDPDLVVRAPDDADRAVLAILAERAVTAHELSAELRARGLAVSDAAVAGKLADLGRAGATVPVDRAVPPLTPAEAERFDRQLPYFAETGDPAEAQRALRAATAVILGCGGLGTWALGALACAGVGRFVLIDDDAVELSNLNRQVLFGADVLGASKAELAAAWVRRFDPAADVVAVRRRVRSPDDLAPLVAGAGVLVQAADWPPYELVRWVDAACREAGVPYITAGQIPPVLKIGPTYAPGRTACFACHERGLRRDFPLYEELTAFRRDHPAPATTLGPASGVVGTLLALEVMHLLTGRRPTATEGRVLLLDMRTLETRWEAIERDMACPACHDLFG
ncbi:MAG TPA: TOMM precursor leader peptide-binding protein [Solirubrobacteraceae bacterium]